MALANSYSPKDFQVYILSESTAGNTALHASDMLQLDVDSVGFPSLNVNQATEVRTSVTSILQLADFYSENAMRVTEISLSGVLHNDAGHKALLSNITSDASTPYQIVGSTFAPYEGQYATTSSSDNKTFTLSVRSPDHSNAYSLVMNGCVCTNFSISADANTEGGRYKWSATIQSGLKPVLTEATTLAGSTVHNGVDISLPTATVKKINDTDIIMQSFSWTIDSPAVFSGVASTGYEVVARGSETSVTADATIKLDSVSRDLMTSYDSGTVMESNAFLLTNGTSFSTTIKNAVFTDVSYNEGDVMMLNTSMKAVASGAEAVISVVTA